MPCVLFEDAHLLAVHKPAGITTHRTGEESPLGMVEFLASQRKDLQNLGIHQRLDRETSGVLIFAKSPEANRSLAKQFEGRSIQKKYIFVTSGKTSEKNFIASEPIDGKPAKTRFSFFKQLSGNHQVWLAEPETGRTHQIRIHAAKHGLPILGDSNKKPGYFEPLLLHSMSLKLQHPVNGNPLFLEAPAPAYFESDDVEQRNFEAARTLRKVLLNEDETNAYRLIHRESDGFARLTVDCLDQWFYIEDFGCGKDEVEKLFKKILSSKAGVAGVICSHVPQGVRREDKKLLSGNVKPSEFAIRENGVQYLLDPMGDGVVGLFFDQRENRRRVQSLSKGLKVLNLFAYTCGFSVAAAMGGASQTVSVDLSRRVLEWGKRNFAANGLPSEGHLFFAGDVFDNLRRMTARKECFGMVIIDPPSFSRSKVSGHFSVKQDLARLVAAASKVLSSGGWMLVSTNLTDWKTEDFFKKVQEGLKSSNRKILEKIWGPQPFDFPVTSQCPAHLKAVWLRLE